MEKVLFFIDIGSSMEKNVIRKESRLDLVKRGISIFLKSKAEMRNDIRHEYGIAALTEQAILLSEFSEDIEKISTTVNNLQSISSFSKFDMNSVFEIISGNMKVPPKNSNGEYKYTIRCIFIYSRPYTPVWGGKEKVAIPEIKKFILKPYFFFDSIYFHTPKTKDSREDLVYHFLVELMKPFDFSSKSYTFKVPQLQSEVIETTFYENFAMLTANPRTRNDQNHQVADLDAFGKQKL